MFYESLGWKTKLSKTFGQLQLAQLFERIEKLKCGKIVLITAKKKSKSNYGIEYVLVQGWRKSIVASWVEKRGRKTKTRMRSDLKQKIIMLNAFLSLSLFLSAARAHTYADTQTHTNTNKETSITRLDS